jgi:hypothetical protein
MSTVGTGAGGDEPLSDAVFVEVVLAREGDENVVEDDGVAADDAVFGRVLLYGCRRSG